MASIRRASLLRGMILGLFLYLLFHYTIFYTIFYYISNIALSENGSKGRDSDFLGSGDYEEFVSARTICNCTVKRPPSTFLKKPLGESTCSLESTMSGMSQKVVSYSFLLKKYAAIQMDPEYYQSAALNVERVKEFYPDWVIRIYSDVLLGPENEMCSFICSDLSIFYCDVSQLPGLGDLRDLDPDLWSVLPLGDATVDKFVVRNMDGVISQRERDAVTEWEASGMPIHVMRDHYLHQLRLIQGLWGGDNYKIGLKTARNMRDDIIHFSEATPSPTELQPESAEEILSYVLYDKFRQTVLAHDSYHCDRYRDSSPFPTERNNSYNYVGESYLDVPDSELPPCPEQCRPAHHRDWNLC